MSVQFVDGCCHYNQGVGFTPDEIAQKWTYNNGSISSPTGRFGRSIQLGAVSKTLKYQAGWVAGAAFNFSTTFSSSDSPLYRISHGGSVLAEVTGKTDQSLNLYGGQGANLLDNSAAHGFFITPGLWYYIEIKTAFSGTTPVLVTSSVHVSPAPGYSPSTVLSGSGSTSFNATQLLNGTAKANNHFFSNGGVPVGGGAHGTFMTDVAIADTDSMGGVNAFFGNVFFGAIYPAVDVTTAWTPSAGVRLFPMVNERFPDGDATYISDGTPGDIANFLFQKTAQNPILAVSFGVYARKDAEGTKTFKQIVGPAGAPTFTGPLVAPGDSYLYDFIVLDLDPNTTAPWTAAGVNSTDFGVKLIS